MLRRALGPEGVRVPNGFATTADAYRAFLRLGGLEPDGIVGLSLFSGLTATLDYPGQELRLTRQPLDPAAHVVPFTSEQGVEDAS